MSGPPPAGVRKPRSRLRRLAIWAGVVVGLLAIIGALGSIKFAQIASLIAMGEAMQESGPPPETVSSAKVEAQRWERTLSAIGSVEGVESVALSNDAPGRVSRIHFESGAEVKQGQVLVELDTSVERAQLAAAISRRDLARITAERSRALVEEKVLAQAQLDNDAAQLETARSDVAALQAQVERKIVRAPFSGRLGIRQVNVGQYLNPGTTLAVLESSGGVFVDFALPQQQLELVRVGMLVRVGFAGAPASGIEGKISAVNPSVDDATRNVRLRAALPNDQDALRPGMFVDVEVVLPEQMDVLMVPATAIVHASYGDSLFVIEKKKPGSPGMAKTPDGKEVKVVRQQFVRLGQTRGDFVAVTEGVKVGEQIVSAGAFKLRNGAPVVVDNSIKLDPKLDPRPENR